MPKVIGSHATTPPPGMFCEVRFPVMLRLDEWTPDGRMIESEGFDVRELPLSTFLLRKTGMGGHEGAEVSGSIDQVTIHEDGTVEGLGWLLDEQLGHDTARLIRSGALRGNSVDLAVEDYRLEIDDNEDMRFAVTKCKLAGTTVCPIPAFEGAYAEIPDDVEIPVADAAVLASLGSYANRHAVEFTPTAVKVTRELPPADAFANPLLTAPTPVMVTSDLRVYGHIAAWGTEHLSASGRITPPRSASEYAYYTNAHVETDAGMLATGPLVIGGQHAAEDSPWTAAIDYYATTSRAWADVQVGEDEFGIWFAGLVRPGTPDNDVYAARASKLSGDWRPIGVDLELVAALSVNAGAFPIPRAFTSNGVQLSLTGAGALPAREMHGNMSAMSQSAESNLAFLANRFAAEEARRVVAEMHAEDE